MSTGIAVARNLPSRPGHGVFFSPNDRLITIGCVRTHGALSAVRIWDVNAGQRVHDFVRPIGVSPFVNFSPDGKWLAAAFILMFENVLPVLANTLAFSPDAKLLASDSLDGASKLWDIAKWGSAFDGISSERAVAGLDCAIRLRDVKSDLEIFVIDIWSFSRTEVQDKTVTEDSEK